MMLFYLLFAESQSFFRNQELWRVINFILFAIFLIYIFRNKIGLGKVLDNRAVAIRKELDQAREEKAEAERKLAEVESRLNRLDAEVAQIREEAEREAVNEAERIRQAAAADAEKLKLTTAREIEGAMKAARTELRAFVAEHSVGMAEAIIKREMKPEDNNRILNRYVEELREVATK